MQEKYRRRAEFEEAREAARKVGKDLEAPDDLDYYSEEMSDELSEGAVADGNL